MPILSSTALTIAILRRLCWLMRGGKGVKYPTTAACLPPVKCKVVQLNIYECSTVQLFNVFVLSKTIRCWHMIACKIFNVNVNLNRATHRLESGTQCGSINRTLITQFLCIILEKSENVKKSRIFAVQR